MVIESYDASYSRHCGSASTVSCVVSSKVNTDWQLLLLQLLLLLLLLSVLRLPVALAAKTLATVHHTLPYTTAIALCLQLTSVM
jgi:hypothetical protein